MSCSIILFDVHFFCSQGANRAAEDAERERREREERMRHTRNPGTRVLPPTTAGRPRGTQDVAPPTPLTPTSHTGRNKGQVQILCSKIL